MTWDTSDPLIVMGWVGGGGPQGFSDDSPESKFCFPPLPFDLLILGLDLDSGLSIQIFQSILGKVQEKVS